ncbi:MAG TPA: hypothetical protein VG674_06195 [Amycolatopsis sp.]|nr:hypothetical protein [Amycolatopsis sp.]
MAAVVAELAEACALCCGVVVFDASRCDIEPELLIEVLHEAIGQARHRRSRIRVRIDEPEALAALTRAGIAPAEVTG